MRRRARCYVVRSCNRDPCRTRSAVVANGHALLLGIRGRAAVSQTRSRSRRPLGFDLTFTISLLDPTSQGRARFLVHQTRPPRHVPAENSLRSWPPRNQSAARYTTKQPCTVIVRGSMRENNHGRCRSGCLHIPGKVREHGACAAWKLVWQAGEVGLKNISNLLCKLGLPSGSGGATVIVELISGVLLKRWSSASTPSDAGRYVGRGCITLQV